MIKVSRINIAHQLLIVGEMSTGRIEAFSDGVFAIVVTLLVLEIHVPLGADSEYALKRNLVAMTPKFLAYALSFHDRLHMVGSPSPFFRSAEKIGSRTALVQ